jgi:hypothetical protein
MDDPEASETNERCSKHIVIANSFGIEALAELGSDRRFALRFDPIVTMTAGNRDELQCEEGPREQSRHGFPPVSNSAEARSFRSASPWSPL